MMRTFHRNFFWTAAVVLLTLSPIYISAQTVPTESVVEKTKKIVDEIIEKSYPELDAKKISVKTFKSSSTFFKAQFSLSRFLTFRGMRTTIFVNPLVFERNAPEEGVRSILAHELGHALYYRERKRLQLIGLVGLIDGGFNAKFERRTDLIAIERGYGEGLIAYREWLYQNVSAKSLPAKKRDYYTPEEIRLLIAELDKNPKNFEKLKKTVPRNLNEVEKALK